MSSSGTSAELIGRDFSQSDARRMAGSRLPAPTGSFAVGARRLFLVDPRPDPFDTGPRKISMTAWYPATANTGIAFRYLSDCAAFDTEMALQLTIGIENLTRLRLIPPVPKLLNVAYRNSMLPNIIRSNTWATKGARANRNLGRLPVVVFSPGFGVPGTHGSILAQDLASHGWLVFTLSHTYESIVTEWPDGVIRQNPYYVDSQWAKCLAARVSDCQYVLDHLGFLANNIGVDADPTQVAVVGHSYGGTTGMALAYAEHRRIKAVCVLDGPVGYPGTSNIAQKNGIAQPVMLLSRPIDSPDSGSVMSGWSTYRTTDHGPLIMLQVAGTQHYSFTDVGYLCGATRRTALCGTIAPPRAMALNSRLVRAFLNVHVTGSPDSLLDDVSAEWPEIAPIGRNVG
ncbi:alpha/beta hydrolase family protein [Nocardia brasiliensis]